MDHIEIAKQAIEVVKPSIEALFKHTVRKELHIVVVDPRVKPWEASFDDAILYEYTMRNSDVWQAPYDEFARNKARQAWREQQPNGVIQQLHPSSLRSEDVPFYGSFVYGNVVVGCSGVQQWFDVLISGWVALAFEQLAIADRLDAR